MSPPAFVTMSEIQIALVSTRDHLVPISSDCAIHRADIECVVLTLVTLREYLCVALALGNELDVELDRES